MPYEISETNGEFFVQNKQTGRRMNKKPYHNKAQAVRYLQALEANMPKNEKKHGAIHTASEQDKLQAIHDHAASLGANCGAMDESETKGLKYMDTAMANGYEVEDNPPDDIRTAAYAVANLCDLLESEDEEPDDLKEIADLIRGLMTFIEGELQEALSGEDPDDAQKSYATMKKLPDGDFLVVDKDGQHLQVKDNGKPDHRLMGAAWAALHEGYRGNKYEGADKQEAISKLKKLYESEKMDLPGEKKSMDLSYVKALGLVIPSDKLAVKFTGRDEISFPTFLWGSPDRMDIEKDFFTRETDFMDSVYGKSPRPLTWDHGQDFMFKDASPVIGTIVDWADDDVARWATATLNKDKAYRNYLDKMIEQKALGASSDSAPQYVERVSAGKGHWIKRWPWIASALTPMPAEPRMKDFTPEFLKSWHLEMPQANEEHSRQMQALALREREIKLKSKIGGL